MGLNPNTLSYPILIIDDDPDVLDVMTKFLQRRGYTNIDSIQDSRLVMSYLKLNDVAVILLDLLMPHVKGSELLPQILKEYPRVPVIMFSGSQDLLGAVDCIKAGALDYLTKPVNQSKVVMSVDKALHMHTFKASHPLKDHLTNPLAFREIVTCSRIMWQTFMYAEQVAETSNIVLITGETGVGKELMAKARSIEHDRDIAMQKDPNFDLAEAGLQIAVVLASVALVAELTALLWVSGGLAVIGILMMLNGYFLLVPIPSF